MRSVAVLVFGLLAGCETIMAPIEDITRAPAKPAVIKPAATIKATPRIVPGSPASGSTYVVQKGDTLFSIAFANGLDTRELAAWNELPSADVIKVGQVLKLTAPIAGLPNSNGVLTMPVKTTEPTSKALPEVPLYAAPVALRLPWSEANWARLNGEHAKPVPAPEMAKPVEKGAATVEPKPAPVEKNTERAEAAPGPDAWLWPAPGALLGRYGESGGKGMDLAGTRGAPILATAAGKVVYSGSGLRGYGQLVIIKHANEYLSAYAHNQKVLVREGEQVSAGQKIAEMGDTDTDRVKLHFEIRQFGKPIDPMKLLPDRS